MQVVHTPEGKPGYTRLERADAFAMAISGPFRSHREGETAPQHQLAGLAQGLPVRLAPVSQRHPAETRQQSAQETTAPERHAAVEEELGVKRYRQLEPELRRPARQHPGEQVQAQ